MTDGIKITGGDLQSTVTLSSSAVTFNGTGFQKVTFDGDTFDSMDDFWNHVRTLRAENARLAKARSAAEEMIQGMAEDLAGMDDGDVSERARAKMRRRVEAYRNTAGD